MSPRPSGSAPPPRASQLGRQISTASGAASAAATATAAGGAATPGGAVPPAGCRSGRRRGGAE